MTPKAQRIAIAEACGWRCEVIGAGWCIYRSDGKVASSGHRADNDIQSLTDYIRIFYGPLNSYVKHPLPDYLNDLNAMAAAEEYVDRDNYYDNLIRVVAKYNDPLPASECIGTHRATAAQRAEAFLRTIRKWVD